MIATCIRRPSTCCGPLPPGTTAAGGQRRHRQDLGDRRAGGPLRRRGRLPLDELLVVTFGRAASQELRERVREQLVRPSARWRDPRGGPRRRRLVGLLAAAATPRSSPAPQRLRDALADFDAATIATTHQFCQSVLRSLGVAGDTDAGAELVEDLDDLMVEVVDDLYLARFGHRAGAPAVQAAPAALQLARDGGRRPAGRARPARRRAGTLGHVRVRFAGRSAPSGAPQAPARRARATTTCSPGWPTPSSDDDAPARQRMRERWQVVLVDEFQDTDPVQWEVFDRAFGGHAHDGADRRSQAGDLRLPRWRHRHLPRGRRDAGDRGARWPPTAAATRRWSTRSQVLLGGAALGDRGIVVRAGRARTTSGAGWAARRSGAVPAARCSRATFGARPQAPCRSTPPRAAHRRTTSPHDVGAAARRRRDVRAASRSRADDVAVLVHGPSSAACPAGAAPPRHPVRRRRRRQRLRHRRRRADWLALLEALEQPHRSGAGARRRADAVRRADAPSELDAGGDDLTDASPSALRGWARLLRDRGVAAVLEAVTADGLAARVLGAGRRRARC